MQSLLAAIKMRTAGAICRFIADHQRSSHLSVFPSSVLQRCGLPNGVTLHERAQVDRAFWKSPKSKRG